MATTDRQNLLSDAQPMGTNNNNTLEADLEAGGQPSILKQSSHPVCLIFHFLFRIGAICTYFFGTWFTDNFVLIFVLCVLLLVFDFWTVKNVSGRLLVGLRWWSENKEDGSTTWLFESRDPSRPLNPVDSRLFWTGLYVAPAIWTVFGILCILTFKLTWLVIVAVALALNMANVIGYTQCDKDAKQKWASGFASNMLGGSGAGGLMGGLMSRGISRMAGSMF
ncbi:MAG: Golgi apparatus membrane protein tvp23 [Linnemannia elongata]|nr:MAG: Golgi apparatus membrane protein tvp23 [Linnemannia elongata]